MPQLQPWARVRARMSRLLRRGAWYRVVELTPTEAVLDVSRRLVRVPRTFVQVLPIRPSMWSVVLRPRDAVKLPRSWGPRYGVCPRCCARAPLPGPAASMRCPKCGAECAIAWSDSHWRAFEVLAGIPESSSMLKSYETALRLRMGI